MSDTPGERQTGIGNHGAKQAGSVEATSRAPGSRTLQAGGEFLKALAGDLTAIGSRLRLSLIANRRRKPPPRAPAPGRISWGAVCGRVLWRLSIVLLGLGTICAGVVCAVTLWVLFGLPAEPRKSEADIAGLQFEARKAEPVGGIGPLKAGEASRQDSRREAETQSRPEAYAAVPSPASSAASPPAPCDNGACANASGSLRSADGSGSSSADAAEPRKAAKAQSAPGAGADQPRPVRTESPDRGPPARQQEISRSLTGSGSGARCNVDVCAVTYKSFHAADCTYQPLGGGPRSVCELNAQSADAAPQTPRAAADPATEAKHPQVAEKPEAVAKSATPARAGLQCNVDACAATYKSFHAADCTYQPLTGGPRSVCELNARSADARPQTPPATTDSGSAAKHPQVAEKPEEVPTSGTSARAGAQCHVDLCAAAYASFHAADCTYQPLGGGPRRICER